MPEIVVKAEGLRKSYLLGRKRINVLDGVDVAIKRGEMVAVMGPSGCGKTTLLNCLSGIDSVDSGRVMVEGNEITAMQDKARTLHRAKRMGFVFQAFNLIPVITAQKNVELPLQLQGLKAKETQQRALAALEQVGVATRAGHKPLEMSGGQQQRVAIARALVNEPAIVWGDEPTGNLDTKTAKEVMDLFLELNKAGATFLIVTHDPKVAKLAHRLLHMDSGRIVKEVVQRKL
ncbi:MAG: ABC transporter ATP-binding protein [Thermoplasmatota archaeon]